MVFCSECGRAAGAARAVPGQSRPIPGCLIGRWEASAGGLWLRPRGRSDGDAKSNQKPVPRETTSRRPTDRVEAAAIGATGGTAGATLVAAGIGWWMTADAGPDSRTLGILAARQARPLQLTEPVRHFFVLIRGVVDDDRQQKRPAHHHQVTAVDRELPFESKIALVARVRMPRDDRDEQGAGFDLAPD